MSGVSGELVRAAYQLFLGRDPESDAAIAYAMRHPTVAALSAAFLQSREFTGRWTPRGVPATAAKLDIDWDVSPRAY